MKQSKQSVDLTLLEESSFGDKNKLTPQKKTSVRKASRSEPHFRLCFCHKIPSRCIFISGMIASIIMVYPQRYSWFLKLEHDHILNIGPPLVSNVPLITTIIGTGLVNHEHHLWTRIVVHYFLPCQLYQSTVLTNAYPGCSSLLQPWQGKVEDWPLLGYGHHPAVCLDSGWYVYVRHSILSIRYQS